MDKLISADALLKTMREAKEWSDKHGGDKYSESFRNEAGEISAEWWCVEDMVDNAKAVEAIPVAWIENFMDGLHNNREILLWSVANVILSKWREEQNDRIQGE